MPSSNSSVNGTCYGERDLTGFTADIADDVSSKQAMTPGFLGLGSQVSVVFTTLVLSSSW